MHPLFDHPHLAGRFHPDYPEDVQVLVHDGGPRLTPHRPEVVWVRLTGVFITDGFDDQFRGYVLNQPNQLQTVREGDEVRFIAAAGSEYLVMVTNKYWQERPDWKVHPCRTCGFSELLDAPSDLIRVIFPDTPPGGEMKMFTTFCPLCGGVQAVEHRKVTPPPQPPRRPWWRFGG